MKSKFEHLTPEQQKERHDALKRVVGDYYDPKSPHYKDIDKFSLAIKTINDSYLNER